MNIFLFKRFRLPVMALLWAIIQTASAQNFTLTLQPDSVTLVPGTASSFVISMTPLDGFTNDVTLSVDTLPSGVTAAFAPNPVKLPGTSLLTLTAATNAAVGSFTLNLTGAGGGITNTTTSTVTVNFGLLPLCVGAITGDVTDLETGLPVTNSQVTASYSFTYSYTATNGSYSFTNLALGQNNTPVNYSVQATASGYWSSGYKQAYAVCEATNIVDLQVLRERYGTISGTVTLQGAPVVGAVVTASGSSFLSATTDAGGHYTITNVVLNYTNAPAYYTVSSQPTGDWNFQTNTYVQADSNSIVNLSLVAVCTGTVTGQVLYADSLLPATNAYVQVYGGIFAVSTNTDANGNYVLPGVALGFDNAVLNTSVIANSSGYYQTSTNVQLATCGETVAAPTLYLVHLPGNNFGAVAGHVYDVQTGLPIAGASVNGAVTDSNGAYLYTNILVGSGTVTNTTIGLQASANGYYQFFTNVVVIANETNTQDFHLLLEGFGGVQGFVRDSATLLPITNTYVSFNGSYYALTDSNGYYFSGNLPLNSGNVPSYYGLYTVPSGYYQSSSNTMVTNGITNTIDLFPIKICAGATIVGNVVDALSQKPITNATLNANGIRYTSTDTNGNFILTNITVGNLNSPIQVTVNATAPGYNPQSHNVTIFCNATIITEFGAPQTAFATIQGLVTNIVTGEPLVNAFIGSEFGEATTTDTNGFYVLTQAPLGPNNSPRAWTVTAIPTNFPAQTLPVTVSSNTISTLNFGFGAPPTHLVLTESSPTNVIPVGSNFVYTITLYNSAADAANVVLSNQLDPSLTFVSATITNPPGGSFTAPVYSNGIVTTTATNLASTQTLVLVIMAIPTEAGPITNITTVTSTTTDTDPTGTNRTAMVINTASAPVVNQADTGVDLEATPEPVTVSNVLTYTYIVDNSGPADAPNVLLDSQVPPNTTFVSANSSQGTLNQEGSALEWSLGTIPNGGHATVHLVVRPLVTGFVTNTANVFLSGESVTDPDPDNDSSEAVSTVNGAVAANVAVQALTGVVFNPQTGLFEQTVEFRNLDLSNTLPGVQVEIPGLPAKVTVYNASGTIGGTPYVEYDQSIAPGQTVDFVLEYYDPTRKGFTSTNFTAVVVTGTSPVAPGGTTLQLDRDPVIHNGQLLIEWASIPGKSYVVQYSGDGETWSTSRPVIVAAGTRVQWIDSGPPKTDSAPGGVGQRFYRVVQLGTVGN